MTESDRRRYPRYALRLQGQMTRSGDHPTLVILDIGEGGVGFEARQAIVPGTRVTIAGEAAGQMRFTLQGVVIWCVEAESAGLPLYRMGMAIEAISTQGETAVALADKVAMLHRLLANQLSG